MANCSQLSPKMGESRNLQKYNVLKSSKLRKKWANGEQEIKTEIYQMSLWHKKFSDLLNIVVIVKTNLRTNKTAHVVLFSSDLTLAYEKLIDYYRLRFQLEFNFRDAKQYWGLEDFMSIKERPVYSNSRRVLKSPIRPHLEPLSNDSSRPSSRLGSRFFQTTPHWSRLMPAWRSEWRRTSPLHPERGATESEWRGNSRAD